MMDSIADGAESLSGAPNPLLMDFAGSVQQSIEAERRNDLQLLRQIAALLRRETMAQYRKRPVVIEATQWNKDGDHPNVVSIPAAVLDTIESRSTAIGINECRWIGTLEGGHIVSPGDWIITGVAGEQYPCKPDIFAATYGPA